MEEEEKRSVAIDSADALSQLLLAQRLVLGLPKVQVSQ